MASINQNSSREAVLKAVKTCGLDLLSADEKFKADREIVLAAVKSNGSIFEDIDKSLQTDREVVLEAVKSEGEVLEDVNDRFKSDREIVLAAVKSKGMALKYASDELKADKEIVLAAGVQNTKSLQQDARMDELLEAVKEDNQEYINELIKFLKIDSIDIDYDNKNLLGDFQELLRARDMKNKFSTDLDSYLGVNKNAKPIDKEAFAVALDSHFLNLTRIEENNKEEEISISVAEERIIIHLIDIVNLEYDLFETEEKLWETIFKLKEVLTYPPSCKIFVLKEIVRSFNNDKGNVSNKWAINKDGSEKYLNIDSFQDDIDWMLISALCMNAWKDACSKKQMAFHRLNKALFESIDLEDSGIEISEDKRKADKKLFNEWKLLRND